MKCKQKDRLSVKAANLKEPELMLENEYQKKKKKENEYRLPKGNEF